MSMFDHLNNIVAKKSAVASAASAASAASSASTGKDIEMPEMRHTIVGRKTRPIQPCNVLAVQDDVEPALARKRECELDTCVQPPSKK